MLNGGHVRRPREGEGIWRRQASGWVTLLLVQGGAREMALHWANDLRWLHEGEVTWRRGKSKSTSQAQAARARSADSAEHASRGWGFFPQVNWDHTIATFTVWKLPLLFVILEPCHYNSICL